MKKILLALLLLCLSPVKQAFATYGVADELGLSPFWNYKTIETDHFRITFPAELTATAQKTAGYLEEAYRLLSPRLKWAASYRANILVIDNQDSENGLTTPEGRFGIALYVSPPDNWESIYYYDNWLRELCIHEYTHFLNMDTTTGLYAPLRYVFGDTLLPTTLWPTWMLEGLAVYMETRLTHAGRGRSPYYEMILRSAVQEGVLDTGKFLTLSKLNPSYPYYPGGETAYTFGYQLMNQAAKTRAPGMTADGQNRLMTSEDALGEMSYRSGGRVPFFINGNLENITGKSWYETWDDFIAATRTRVGKELEIIRAKPLTTFKRFTEKGYTVLGPRYSPDHQWLAYSQDSLDDTSSALYLKNLKTGKTDHLFDKTAGATLSFTPDSKTIFSSRLHRINDYYLYSDLDVYDIDHGDHYFLTHKMRARDPSVSPDGKQIAFTFTKDATTSLALAPLILDGGKYKMGQAHILFKQAKLDRVATPQFSPDGKRIAFSFHKNGDLGEEIRVFNLDTKVDETIASNGHFNRFPTWDADGNIYFVSDITGVDNLYRSNRPSKIEMLSNLETGMQFPSFAGFGTADKGKYLGTVFSTQGYDIAEFDLPTTPYQTAELQMPDVPAPVLPPADVEPTQTYPVKNYSIWPTILPRTWAPILVSDGNGVYAGGEIGGFDQVDRQRYLFVGAYDSFTQSWDTIIHYENRMLGPTIEGTSSIYTSAIGANGGTLLDYQRTEKFTLDMYYTFQWTYSSLTPLIQLNEQRDFLHVPGAVTSQGDIVAKDAWVPHVDGSLAYTDEENSRIAIAPENGRYALGGARAYQNGGDRTWKAILTDSENIEFGESHVVLVPSFKGSYVSRTSNYGPSNVLVQGRFSGQVINSLAADNFDQIAIRGYPLQAYYTKAATVYGLDLRFPILRIYDGIGTDPAYFNYIYGFTFGEATYFPAGDIKPNLLPSAGGGLRLTTQLLNYVPLTFSVEYHDGFKQSAGGTGELFFQVLAAAISL